MIIIYILTVYYQVKKTTVEVPVKQKDGTVKYHDTGLYYHKNAHELAVIGWNKRKGVRENDNA